MVCDSATRKVASSANYLGQQEAARKRRPTSQKSGACIGAVFRSDDEVIGILISQEKWNKVKSIIAKWMEVLKEPNALLNRKDLERDRGFLVHISMAYPTFTPYLKGLHLTLEMWRPDRDPEGWKLPKNDWARLQVHFVEHGMDPIQLPDYSDAPDLVERAPRLEKDLLALETLTRDVTPPLRVVRSRALKAMGVSFCDASGKGKGPSTIGREARISIMYAKDARYIGESSNFREFQNLVETLESQHKNGNLDNLEVFIYADNEVTERAFYKGTSKSPKLFDLVLRLRLL